MSVFFICFFRFPIRNTRSENYIRSENWINGEKKLELCENSDFILFQNYTHEIYGFTDNLLTMLKSIIR